MIIDSPVVSREHATISVDLLTGAPHVFVTDTKSMHGTFVNETALVPFVSRPLSNGDKLRFGINVNRNESQVPFTPHSRQTTDDPSADYYVAYDYTFNAELSNHEPFSRGFTVPEADSEEEELHVQPAQGSQLHPVVLDDSDDAEDREDPDDEITEYHPGADINVSVGGEDITVFVEDDDDEDDDEDDDKDDDEDGDEEGLEEPEVRPDYVLEVREEYLHLPEAGSDDLLEGGGLSAYQLNEVAALAAEASGLSADEDDSDSNADSMIESDIENEAESDDDRPRSDLFSPKSPPAFEAVYKEVAESHQWATFEKIQETPAEQVHVDSVTNKAVLDYDPSQQYTDYLSMPLEGSAFEVEGAFSNPPPLPPRPSQKRQKIEAAQDNKDVCETAFLESVPSSMPAADRLQTPPFTAPADAGSPLSSPLTFKNSVLTIPELIDDQPPTPTSVKNLKRSADNAFDDEVKEGTEQEAVQSAVEVAVPTSPTLDAPLPGEAAIPTVEQTVPQDQRPIAQPKSIRHRVAHAAAKAALPATAYIALGFGLAVTTLTSLPESFFTMA
jgi:pSer/pThr/pTyr-binding forkhead associated (FHA) protein